MTFSRIILLALVATPLVAFAQATGLVPCSGPDCQACDILKLIQNIINNFFIPFAVMLAVIGLAWDGFKMVTSGSDNPLLHSVFRQRLKNIVIGFILMLGAWVIVDTVMKLFLNDQQFGSWNKIQCIAQPVPTQGAFANVGTTGTSTTPTVITNASSTAISGTVGGKPYLCTDCVDLRSLGFNCKESQCFLDKGTAAKLAQLSSTYPLRITEAMPPTVRHSAECHSTGHCVDATISNVTNASEAVIFANTASAAGIRAVWEGADCATRDKIRAATGNPRSAYCKSDSGFGHITGTHYSLYSN
ncbi:hypothetical protein A3C87_01945 [Candidatus Kaiserbacteria bacterium RIFCSPHIGHO2_02_FULL_49_34]|uniref:SCP domain-containing protein n=1 Tax=Candidatus Kaiserbacteria bacterium RIFCSPHIGHO2_02_FULL_49_34 TaxID=1798491 RepID=A0A1F6DJ48_9BACT|nr:MAG: hypothetical protein A3C87_01945 [Candidatus Kaiserbacteria bacterium RIFCSPHIGHO2_02_FULL_49_34]